MFQWVISISYFPFSYCSVPSETNRGRVLLTGPFGGRIGSNDAVPAPKRSEGLTLISKPRTESRTWKRYRMNRKTLTMMFRETWRPPMQNFTHESCCRVLVLKDSHQEFGQIYGFWRGSRFLLHRFKRQSFYTTLYWRHNFFWWFKKQFT